MFAVRVGLGQSKVGRGRHRLASKIRACARAQSPRAAHGLHAHTTCAIGGRIVDLGGCGMDDNHFAPSWWNLRE